MESLLFLMGLLLMSYLCWRVFKADKADEPKHKQLQLLDFKAEKKS